MVLCDAASIPVCGLFAGKTHALGLLSDSKGARGAKRRLVPARGLPMDVVSDNFSDTFFPPSSSTFKLGVPFSVLSAHCGQSCGPPRDAGERFARQMAFRQLQLIVSGMFDQRESSSFEWLSFPGAGQPPSSLYRPLLQTRQRPVVDLLGQYQPPPQVVQVEGQQAQRQPYLIRAEATAAQPRHLHRLFGFLYPLFRRVALVAEPHHGLPLSQRPGIGRSTSPSCSHLRECR